MTALRLPRRAHKYHATAVVLDGERIASKAEARRFEQLKLLQRAKEISKLERQPRFSLLTVDEDGFPVAVRIGKRAATYVADFRYVDKAGVVHVEDVKGVDLPLAKLKRAIAEANYGFTVELVRMRAR